MAPIHRPLAYVFISFCCGIAVGRHLPVSSIQLVVLATLLCGWLGWRTVRGHCALFLPAAIFIIVGAVASQRIPDPDRPPPGIRQLLQYNNAVLIGTVCRSPEQSPNRNRLRLRLEAFKEGDNWRPVSGDLFLNVRDPRRNWSVGQRLIGRVRLMPVRNFNNPGSFDYRQYLADLRIWVRGYAWSDADLVPLGKPEPNPWGRLLQLIRARSRAFLQAWLPLPHAALYGALLLGERYALSSELHELLYNAGIGHLLAISGLHLGMVAGLAFLVFHSVLVHIPAVARRWGARPVAALAAFPVAVGYALLTGMALPALRATLMLAVFTLALIIRREKDLLNSLLLAALLILTFNPEALFSASFQLSFVAVLALVWLLPRVPVPRALQNQAEQKRKWRLGCRRLYQFICASLIVSIFTAPIVLYHFHRLTPAGIVTNLLVVPLVGFFILPTGLLALLFMPFSVTLAGLMLTLGSLGLTIVLTLVSKVDALSWATLWPGTPSAWQAALAYVLLLLFVARIPRWQRFALLTIGSLVLAALWVAPADFLSNKSLLRVTYLDVGQGNCAVVELPGGAAMLIDGGGIAGSSFDVGRQVVAPYLWKRGIRRLEAMVLSHAHPDHFLGLTFMAAHFPVKQFWFNKVLIHDPDFTTLMNCLARKKIACLGPQDLPPRQRMQGVDIQILHPPPDFAPVSAITTNKEQNNLSLVLRLRYKRVSFLFPGDIEKETEYRLLTQSTLEPVDVLLVPHHGSLTSSSPPFLKRLRPQIAVYSVGFHNRFHLPATRVRERYRSLNVRTHRTDRHGAVTVTTDGHRIEVETFLKARDNEAMGGKPGRQKTWSSLSAD